MLESGSAVRALAAAEAIKKATISAARASVHQAQIDLDRTTIRAPISGVVIERRIEPGQTLAASLSAPEMFTIAEDLGQIEVHARVDEADVGKVHDGQTVTFSVDAYPQRRFEGIVHQIRKAPEISQGVVSYTVVISASNPDARMLPGMTALVEIVTARKDKVLRVPNAALRFDLPASGLGAVSVRGDSNGTSPGVWLIRSDREFERAPLVIGYSDGEFTEVTSGPLTVDDRVIVGYRR
jgi:HlyD family secretion protein